MKKRLFIVAALIIGMIACLASCKKKTTEPTIVVPQESEIVCLHDSLIHVMPLEPTADENGCIEHYVCYECRSTFADAEGKTPLSNTILWATNLVIDDENIVENELYEYASDSSYMLKANLEVYAGLGNIGTLWPDYTDWENWTQEEWDAYWYAMHEYYIEWGGGMEFEGAGGGAFIAKTIFSIFLSRIINNCLDNIDKNIMMFFDDNYVINEKLDNIMNKLGEIQNSIKELSDKMTLQEYKTVMQNRYSQQVPLEAATTSYFKQVLDLMAREKKDFSELPEDVLYQIKDISNQWHNQIVAGNNIETTFQSMLVFAGGDFITGQKLPAVYDFIANSSIPWEHQGYVFREMARSADVVLMAECYLMTIIYHKTHPGQVFDQSLLNNKMMGYSEVLKSVQIDYHNDRYICQIPGAKIELERQLLELKPWDYICKHVDKDLYMSQEARVDDFLKYMNDKEYTDYVDQNWFKTVFSYYKIHQPNKNAHQILSDIGFSDVNSYRWIIAGCGNDYKYGDEIRTCRCFKYATYRSSNNDWLGFHTAINDKCDFEQANIAMNMNIRRTTNLVYDKGDKIHSTFCTLMKKK